MMKKDGSASVSLDIIYNIAQQHSSPADVQTLAKLNKDTWALLEPVVYEKEVTYTKATQRLAHKERKDLYLYVLAAFGGLHLETLPEEWDKAWDPNFPPDNIRFMERHIQYEVLQQRLVTEDKHGLALHRAIADGPKESLLISKLMTAAQIYNQQGYLDGLHFPILPPPLMKAAGVGHVPTIRQLLVAGCNTDI